MTSPAKIWRGQKKLSELFGKSGRIITWTITRVAPEGFVYQAPYPVALIALKNGKKIVAQVTDYTNGDLKRDRKVVLVIRRTGKTFPDEIISYGIKAKLL